MISDFCIRRPIFASVLSIVVTLAGLQAIGNDPSVVDQLADRDRTELRL